MVPHNPQGPSRLHIENTPAKPAPSGAATRRRCGRPRSKEKRTLTSLSELLENRYLLDRSRRPRDANRNARRWMLRGPEPGRIESVLLEGKAPYQRRRATTPGRPSSSMRKPKSGPTTTRRPLHAWRNSSTKFVLSRPAVRDIISRSTKREAAT